MNVRYYDEFNIGDVFTSPTRTITEFDLIQFAGNTGDNNPLHTDEEAAKKTIFGTRIAHGMLGASIGIGLWCRLGLMDGSALAFLGTNWDFKNAIKIGDTIHSVITVGEKRETKTPGRGIITLDFEIKNQKGEVCQVGQMKLMVGTKAFCEAQNN